VLAAAVEVGVRALLLGVAQHRPEVRRLVALLAGGARRVQGQVVGEPVGALVADVVVHVVRAVGQAEGDDEVIRVAVVVLVVSAPRNESTFGCVGTGWSHPDVRLDLLDVDEVAGFWGGQRVRVAPGRLGGRGAVARRVGSLVVGDLRRLGQGVSSTGGCLRRPDAAHDQAERDDRGERYEIAPAPPVESLSDTHDEEPLCRDRTCREAYFGRIIRYVATVPAAAAAARTSQMAQRFTPPPGSRVALTGSRTDSRGSRTALVPPTPALVEAAGCGGGREE